jgi:uncharacterized membrane protein YeaQ/YmgE (transglycosylase-associated protein family)
MPGVAADHGPPGGPARLPQPSGVAIRLFGMGLLLLLVLLVIILGGLAVLAVGFTFGLLLTLLVAGLVGWLADLVVPGRLPGGWIGAVLSGLIGGLIGTWLFAALRIHVPGLSLFGVDLIPAFVGAVIIAAAMQLLTMRRAVR